MSISDEAVKAMYEALPGWVSGYLDPETMREALEAAAPHMTNTHEDEQGEK